VCIADEEPRSRSGKIQLQALLRLFVWRAGAETPIQFLEYLDATVRSAIEHDINYVRPREKSRLSSGRKGPRYQAAKGRAPPRSWLRVTGQVMAALRNLAISLLHLNGITKIKATLQEIGRDRDRVLTVLPL
jgi:hypothetical protein